MTKLYLIILPFYLVSCSSPDRDSDEGNKPMISLEADNESILRQLDQIFPENMPVEEAKEKLIGDGFQVREQWSSSPNAMNYLIVGTKSGNSENFMLGISIDTQTNLVIGGASVTRY